MDGNDVLNGGPGRDSITYFLARRSVHADLARHRASGEGLDLLLRIESVEGSPYDDVLIGSRLPNAIDGGNGSDVVDGRGGNDRLIGGRGDDRLRGRAGNDVIDDSLGVAQGVYPDTGRDHLDGGVGDDRLDAVDEVGGNDTLGGGAGTDVCLADVGDVRSSCGP
jgi:Ca2+-binding RTX toxin-like protein